MPLACFDANSNISVHFQQTKRTVPLVCFFCFCFHSRFVIYPQKFSCKCKNRGFWAFLWKYHDKYHAEKHIFNEICVMILPDG